MSQRRTTRGRGRNGAPWGGNSARDGEVNAGDRSPGQNREAASGDLTEARWMTPELYLRIKEMEAEQREKDRQHELRVLEMQLEIASSSPEARSDAGGSGREQNNEIDIFAKRIRGVIEKMPINSEHLPSWFRGVEADYKLMQVPERLWGTLLIPFLSTKGRGLIAHLSPTQKADFKVLKSELLKGFRLSPEEYYRKVQSASKEKSESWTQFVSRLEDLYEYYLDSRKVSDLGTVKKLAVSDLLKEKLPPNVRQHVLLQEGRENWLPAGEIALLCEKFEEAQQMGASKDKNETSSYRARESTRFEKGDAWGKSTNQSMGGRPRSTVGRDADEERRCWVCNLPGHFGRECPQKKKKVNEESKGTQKKVFCVGGDDEETDITDPQGEEKLIAHVGCSTWDETRIPTSVEPVSAHKVKCTGGECPTVELLCGENKLTAILDSGCEISVLRTDIIPPEFLVAKGRVKLVSAFGEKLEADLVEVPVRGADAPEEAAVALTCAVTKKMAKSVQALLRREDWERIKAEFTSIRERTTNRAVAALSVGEESPCELMREDATEGTTLVTLQKGKRRPVDKNVSAVKTAVEGYHEFLKSRCMLDRQATSGKGKLSLKQIATKTVQLEGMRDVGHWLEATGGKQQYTEPTLQATKTARCALASPHAYANDDHDHLLSTRAERKMKEKAPEKSGLDNTKLEEKGARIPPRNQPQAWEGATQARRKLGADWRSSELSSARRCSQRKVPLAVGQQQSLNKKGSVLHVWGNNGTSAKPKKRRFEQTQTVDRGFTTQVGRHKSDYHHVHPIRSIQRAAAKGGFQKFLGACGHQSERGPMVVETAQSSKSVTPHRVPTAVLRNIGSSSRLSNDLVTQYHEIKVRPGSFQRQGIMQAIG